MTLYIKYSKDPPGLPEAVAESKSELARLLGVSINSVISSYSHGRSTFVEVEVEDEPSAQN